MGIVKSVGRLLSGRATDEEYMFWYRYKDQKKQNFGDIIGPFLFEYLSGIRVRHIEDKTSFLSSKYIPHYLTVGSILSFARKSSIVWGSGIINRSFDVNTKAKYLAVRGPITREKILAQGGECPEIYGDPALLLSKFIPQKNRKNQKVTIIPHYVDYEQVKEQVKDNNSVDVVKMMTADFYATLHQINSSNLIISSSLHGLIIAAAYEIPCLWVEFSDKIFGDDVKYHDFFSSLGIVTPKKQVVEDIPLFLDNLLEQSVILADIGRVQNLQKGLLSSYPLPIKEEIMLTFNMEN